MGRQQVLPPVGLADQVRLLASTAGESDTGEWGTPSGGRWSPIAPPKDPTRTSIHSTRPRRG